MPRFDFDSPATIRDAKARKRRLENDVADISRQLALNPKLRNNQPIPVSEYKRWRQSTRHALVTKEAEIRFLKDWILERRRERSGARLDIEDVNDPIDILIACRTELRRFDDKRARELVDTIDQFLMHSA